MIRLRGLLERLADQAGRELALCRLLLRDPRTPWISRALFGAALLYLLMPFDLVPDWIPLLGQIDDLLLVPLLVLAGLWFVPKDVLDDCRARVIR